MKYKKKILFISWYYEVLKTYLPYIKYFSKEFDIYVIAHSLPSGNDEDKCKTFLDNNNINGQVIKSNNSVDYVEFNKLTNKKVIDSKYANFVFLINEKKAAYKLFDEIQPDLIFLVSDTREFERYIIQKAKIEGVPSINFQFSMGPISKKLLIDNRTENTLKYKSGIFFKELKKYSLFSLIYAVLNRIFNLVTPSYANCYGGGDSDVFCVIGEGSKIFYTEMGINPLKINITGNAFYEEIYKDALKSNTKDSSIFNILNIPYNSRIICYLTTSRKEDYYKSGVKYNLDVNDELNARIEKIKLIVNNYPDCYIVIKIHPRTVDDNSYHLKNISKNIRIIQDIDLLDIMPHASLIINRASTASIYAMLYNIPVITHNYPPIPLGNLFKELGGTIHANNSLEFSDYISLIMNKDQSILELIGKRKKEFLLNHLNINQDAYSNSKSKNTLQSLLNMNEIIYKLTK
jgi:hypothetical protein